MATSSLERFAPLSGVLAVVLIVIGFIIVSDSPDFLDPAQELATYYADDSGKVIAADYLGLLGTAALVWFVGVVRSRLRVAERGTGRLSATALAGGTAGAVLLFTAHAFDLAGGLRADEDGRIDPAAATILYDMAGLLIAVAAMAFAVLVLATALLALRTGVLPRWLGWVSLPLGIGLLSPISWVFAAIFLLWVLAVAVLLYIRPVVETPVAVVP